MMMLNVTGLLFVLRYDRGCGIGNFEFKAESNKTR